MAKKAVEKEVVKPVLDQKVLQFVKVSLLALLAYFVLFTILTQGIVYGLQHALNIVVLVIAVREAEILFYAHDKKLVRKDAKAFVTDNQAFITALTIALFIPYFTPVVMTVIIGVLSVVVAKLLFGGYAYRIVSPALLAAVMLSLGFRISLSSVVIPNTFDTQIFRGLANLPLFSNTLNTVLSLDSEALFTTLLTQGSIVFGLIFVAMLTRFSKTVWFALLSVVLFVLGYVVVFQDQGYIDILLSTPFLITVVFVLTDAVLLPKSNTSKLVNTLVFAVLLNVFILIGQVHAVLFAGLTMQILIPFFNQSTWFTPLEEKAPSVAFTRTRYSVIYSFVILSFLVVAQLGWSYYGPQIGKPKVDVLQYFEAYETYTQRFTPSRTYNSDAYDAIQDVYEIEDENQTLVLLAYNMIAEGFWGPINVIVVVDPYTDVIVNYYVVRHEEVQGAAYFDEESVGAVLNQNVSTFDIPVDVSAGATGTFNALQEIVTDVVNHYTNEEVSLNENTN
jgi:Na+-translocating ferredoxin:NAD+ oxidoreductase RnfD subunit